MILWGFRSSLKSVYGDWQARSHGVTIIDNFYTNPDAIRKMALNGGFKPYPHPGSGLISNEAFDMIWPWVRKDLNIQEVFKNCDLEKANLLSGYFHMTPKGSHLGESFVHKDTDKYNMIIYLNPDADGTGSSNSAIKGTTIWKRKSRFAHLPWSKDCSFDPWQWKRVCDIPMKYNRLVLFDGNMWHSRGDFSDWGLSGTNKDDSRLVQVFWFETVPSLTSDKEGEIDIAGEEETLK